MAYPSMSNRFGESPPQAKEVDKSKLWYDGWQDDARQEIFEQNHYGKTGNHTNMCRCVKCDPYAPQEL